MVGLVITTVATIATLSAGILFGIISYNEGETSLYVWGGLAAVLVIEAGGMWAFWTDWKVSREIPSNRQRR